MTINFQELMVGSDLFNEEVMTIYSPAAGQLLIPYLSTLPRWLVCEMAILTVVI